MKQLLQKLKGGSSKERFSFGLDIGTSVIKIAKLKLLKDSVELAGFDLDLNRVDLSDLLKGFAKSQGAQTINISVSGPATVIRCVSFPRMSAAELKQSLKFEAQKYIPFSSAETDLDGHILKDDLPDNKMLILIAAVKKEFLNTRLKLIQDAGLKIGVVDIDSLALVNAFNFNFPDEGKGGGKAVALLNIGASTCNLDILENSLPRLNRNINIAGNNFTQKVADVFGTDFKAAESLKINPGENAAKVKAAVESVLTALGGEIRTSFDYYESQSSFTVGKIFLSGGGSKFGGLREMLASFLGIEVDYWNPVKKINLAAKLDPQKLDVYSSQLAVSIGLALR